MACVYILTNQTIPGLLKIGFTGGTAADRAADISRGTGVPSPYAVHWFLETTTTEAAHAVEQLVHQTLATERHNRAREFFTTSLPVAIDTIQRIAYQQGAIANDLTVIARLLAEERAEEQRIQRKHAQREQAQREDAEREQREKADWRDRRNAAAHKLLTELDAQVLASKGWFRRKSDYALLQEFTYQQTGKCPYALLPGKFENLSQYKSRLSDNCSA